MPKKQHWQNVIGLNKCPLSKISGAIKMLFYYGITRPFAPEQFTSCGFTSS